MNMDRNSLYRLRDEATDRFIGQGGVVGVGIGQAERLTILVSELDPTQQRALDSWASARAVGIDVIVAGNFLAGTDTPL